jgi:hypothetical protein
MGFEILILCQMNVCSSCFGYSMPYSQIVYLTENIFRNKQPSLLCLLFNSNEMKGFLNNGTCVAEASSPFGWAISESKFELKISGSVLEIAKIKMKKTWLMCVLTLP